LSFLLPGSWRKEPAIFESLILESVTRLRAGKEKGEKALGPQASFLKAWRGMSGLGTVERKKVRK
jgi:hypothetical protein